LRDLLQGERLEVLLLDAAHLRAMLFEELSPQQLLQAVRDSASFNGQAYAPMKDVWKLVRQQPQNVSTSSPGSSHTSRQASAPEGAPLAASQYPDSSATWWNPARTDRGNPQNGYVAFQGRQTIYAWAAVICGAWIIFLLLLFLTTGLTGKVLSAAAALFLGLLTFGFWNMARRPIRFEVGAYGMQVFARGETAWIPWEVVERVEIIRVDGNPTLVAWSRFADRFPDTDVFKGGPRYLPRLKATAVCPLHVLRAKRHEVVRALAFYGAPGYADAADRRATARTQQQATAAYEMAEIAERAGDWPTAISGYTAVLNLDPTHPDAAQRRENCRGRRHITDLQTELRMHADAGDWAAVIAVDTELAALDPTSVDLDGLATRARQQLSKPRTAATLAQSAAEALAHTRTGSSRSGGSRIGSGRLSPNGVSLGP
jgi:hypothetical protein